MDKFYEDLTKEIDAITVSLEQVHVELPPKIKQGMEKIGVLDKKVAEKMAEIETTKAEFLEYFKEMDAQQKEAACDYIEKGYQEAADMSARKIKIAKGIRKNIEKVKREFQEGTQNFIENYPEPEVPKSTRKARKKAAKKEKKQPSAEEPCSSSSVAPSSSSEVPSKKGSRLKKKKVAEEEQLWCYCREEKPGEMIFCEDPECPIQWFHFECIGMTVAPEGDWFCKECLAKMLEDPFDDEPTPLPKKKTNHPQLPEEFSNHIQQKAGTGTPKKLDEKKTVKTPVSFSDTQRNEDDESKKELKTFTEEDETSEEEPDEPVIEIVSTPDVASFEEVA